MAINFLSGEKDIVFYDKNCKFCVYCAFFFKKRTHKLYFFSLQSLFAAHFFQTHRLGNPLLDSVYLWNNKKIYKASNAILRIFFFAKIQWKIFAILGLLFPCVFRDKIYFFIAKKRSCNTSHKKK